MLDIHHGRTFTTAQYRETEVAPVVETRGPHAVVAMLKAIAAKGYQARSFAFD
jgi:hypothetical protein